MDRYAQMDQRTPSARHEATWSAIASCAYLAPAHIALDDRRERILAEAAQARLLANKRSVLRTPRVLGARRHPEGRKDLPRRIVGLLRVVLPVGLLGCAGLGSRSPGAEAPHPGPPAPGPVTWP